MFSRLGCVKDGQADVLLARKKAGTNKVSSFKVPSGSPGLTLPKGFCKNRGVMGRALSTARDAANPRLECPL